MKCGTQHVMTLLLVSLLLVGASTVAQARQTRQHRTVPGVQTEQGLASVYSTTFNGRRTASGIRLDQQQPMVAHKHLPFGTWVTLTNLQNRRSVTAVVMDRGPRHHGRIVDMTHHVARALHGGHTGLLRVSLEVVERPHRVKRT